MNILRIVVATICLAVTLPVLGSSLTDDCDVDCLQPKLDSRIEQADKLFDETVESVSSASREAPEAKIDSAIVISELRAAKKQWEEFADHECAAAREFVGIGTDRDSVELACLIQLYDQRIRELKAWDEL